jgi:hypothetical protein
VEDETFKHLYLEELTRINNIYIPGTFEYIKQNQPELFKELYIFERKLNELWGFHLELFKRTLSEYYDFNAKLIQVFSESEKGIK